MYNSRGLRRVPQPLQRLAAVEVSRRIIRMRGEEACGTRPSPSPDRRCCDTPSPAHSARNYRWGFAPPYSSRSLIGCLPCLVLLYQPSGLPLFPRGDAARADRFFPLRHAALGRRLGRRLPRQLRVSVATRRIDPALLLCNMGYARGFAVRIFQKKRRSRRGALHHRVPIAEIRCGCTTYSSAIIIRGRMARWNFRAPESRPGRRASRPSDATVSYSARLSSPATYGGIAEASAR